MSAIGTTLGPPLGGLMMAGLGWRSIFLVNVPLGILNFLLARRCLPPDQPAAATPLIQWDLLRDRRVAASLGLSALVSMVMMSTLVVGPFYLARALGLSTEWMGVALAAGPMVAALSGVPAGRLVDRYGARPMTAAGLVGIAAGCMVIAAMPAWFGVAGYLLPLVSVTASYALFQAANNTSLMSGVRAEQRGVTAGVLNLSRNLGLIAGASAMGAVFAFGIGNSDVSAARPEAVATGMRLTFAVSAALIAAGLAVATRLANPVAAPRPSACEWRPAPATERPVQ
jgi:predicted MFS family arabinose efflux permease